MSRETTVALELSFDIHLSGKKARQLERAAKVREQSVAELVSSIIDTVIAHNLFDAVLDDGE